jgi:SPP1 gp7 family putative phage head morphogenesis protein
MRSQIVGLLEALSASIPGLLYDAGTVAATTAPEAVKASLDALQSRLISLGNTALSFTFTAPSLSALLAVALDAPYDGRNWNAWGQKLAGDVLGRVESEMRQAVALGETVQQARKRLQVAADLGRVSAERLARTMMAATGDRARFATYQANADVIDWLEFLAVLDLRTSPVCIAASGRRFRLDDPELPAFRPPMHPNCRSVLIPIIDLPGVPVGEQASQDGPVPANWSYGDWLKRQSREYQEEALGPTLAAAFRRGLPLSAVATSSRPLAISELRRLYPDQMGG